MHNSCEVSFARLEEEVRRMKVSMIGMPWSRVMALRGCRTKMQGFERVRPEHGASTQCFSSNRDGDKSWGEIAEDTANVAKNIIGKVVKTGTSAIESITGKSKKKPAVQQEQQEDIFKVPGGGLMDKLIGGVLNSAFRSLGEQLQESQRSAQDTYSRASSRVMNSSRVRNSIGEPRCQPPSSQSSSSQSVNGVVSKTTSIMFAAVGPTGSATVQADAIERPNGAPELRVKVRLPNGQVVNLEDDDQGGSGRVIDAEWKEA